jgi:O-antigen/teichoic acid export membrane protein
MSLIRRNVVANFLGSGWNVLLSLALVPFYISIMGIESYGLIGIFTVLLAILAPLEAGLGTTLNRELAELSGSEGRLGQMRDAIRTLEWIYWPLALLAGSIVVLLAPWITSFWVQPENLPLSAVRWAVTVMGVVIVFQWPLGLYAGGLAGLQRQVTLNAINIGAATVRGLGALVVLIYVSPTIVAFFSWQVVATLLHTSVTGLVLWKSVPAPGRPPQFQRELLRRARRFIGELSGIALIAVALTQLDKVILSRLLTLEVFGYYALAATVAASLLRLVGPIQQAAFPRFSQLAATGGEGELAALYHRMSQLMSVVTLPAAVFIVVFSPELLLLWTGSPEISRATWPILSLLMAGTAFNGLMHLPYSLQLAHGWARLALVTSFCAALILVPAVFLLALRYGAVGGAAVWLMLNFGYFVITVQLMHRRLLQGEKRSWYFSDVGLPLAVSVGIALVGRLLVREMATPALLAVLFVIAVATQLAATLSTETTRSAALAAIRGKPRGPSPG